MKYTFNSLMMTERRNQATGLATTSQAPDLTAYILERRYIIRIYRASVTNIWT